MLGVFCTGSVPSVGPITGLKDAPAFTVETNTPFVYRLPKNALLFAFEVKGTAIVKVGSSEAEMGNLGEITSNGSGILQIGLLEASEVWLQADMTVSITPIIYVR